jgi:glycine/D-amino acid oxidase-like deaminating enzyme
MTETADVVIIGAGIVGAACAEALTRDGMRVTVIESGAVGGGATAAGMGHVVVMDDSEAQFALTRYSRDLWIKSVPLLPPEVEFEARGTLWVAADEEEFEAVRQKEGFYTARGVRAEALDARALAAEEPNLRSNLAGALLVPDDSVVYAPCAAHQPDRMRHWNLGHHSVSRAVRAAAQGSPGDHGSLSRIRAPSARRARLSEKRPWQRK